jgi:hypothetical protein
MSFFIGITCIGDILCWCRLEERQLTAYCGGAYLKYGEGTWL